MVYGATTRVRDAGSLDRMTNHSTVHCRLWPQRPPAARTPATVIGAAGLAQLAAVGGGGTNVSAPLALLNAERAAVDLVVIVSDNQSWVDVAKGPGTATMHEWTKLVKRNPQAKLVVGFGPIMPTFQGQISEDQLVQLVAFIKSLPAGGQTQTTAASPAASPTPNKK